MKNIIMLVIGVAIFIVLVILFFPFGITTTCSDCYTVRGYLVGYCDDSKFHYMINRTDGWGMDKVYCSEGFPDNFESYFGKHVEIKGHVGCGRRSINNIKELN